MDEPELLMQLLATIAKEKLNRGGHRPEWSIVYLHAQNCVEALEEANEAPHRG
jgi:hypothetical protein